MRTCGQVELVDEELLKALSFTAGGLLPPLATVVGGLAAQEALIALTGKFSPLKQWVRDNEAVLSVTISISIMYIYACLIDSIALVCTVHVFVQLYLDAVEVLSGQESLDSTSFLPK